MIDLLEGYSEYMLSKLMCAIIPNMIDQANDTVLGYFNSAIY